MFLSPGEDPLVKKPSQEEPAPPKKEDPKTTPKPTSASKPEPMEVHSSEEEVGVVILLCLVSLSLYVRP